MIRLISCGYCSVATIQGDCGLSTGRALLKGAVDMHIHTGPDIYPRSVDDIEAAQQAKAAGMRAIVIKGHDSLTSARAAIATKVTGLPVFGGLVLNMSVGGLNAVAVQRAIALGSKIIWGPTTTGRNFLTHKSNNTELFSDSVPEWIQGGVTVLDDRGKILPEVFPILEMIAQSRIILASGDFSVDETVVLFREAERAGVKKLLVTHPQVDWMRFPLNVQLEMAGLGAKMEHCISACNKLVRQPIRPSEIAREIKAVGVENSVMSSDGGWAGLPPPVKLLEEFIQEMLNNGISEEEIRVMTSRNPSWLLGMN